MKAESRVWLLGHLRARRATKLYCQTVFMKVELHRALLPAQRAASLRPNPGRQPADQPCQDAGVAGGPDRPDVVSRKFLLIVNENSNYQLRLRELEREHAEESPVAKFTAEVCARNTSPSAAIWQKSRTRNFREVIGLQENPGAKKATRHTDEIWRRCAPPILESSVKGRRRCQQLAPLPLSHRTCA